MLEQAIAWFNDRKGKVTYSMIDRNGLESYDCSSSEYYSLIDAGVFPSTISIGNTDTLFGDLERHGFTQVPAEADGSITARRGDVGIWGVRGQSAGSVGHTFTFIDPDNIIHCSSGYNGIAVSNHDWLWSINGEPPLTVYRYTGLPAIVNNPTDQIVEAGSWVKFSDTYTVDDLQVDSSIWQIKTNALCNTGFTWDDNGIPAALVTEVDSEGYATSDQELAVGSLYRIPGKFNVLDVGLVNGEWLAQVGFGSLTFWVDIATATEVTGDDPGTATPSQRQTNAETPPAMPTPTVEQRTPIPSPITVQTPLLNHPIVLEPVNLPAGDTKDKVSIIQNILNKIESKRNIFTNIVITFFQTAGAAWAVTGFAMDKLALTGAIGAGLSAIWNTIIKPLLVTYGWLK